jgi:hypothetical protein
MPICDDVHAFGLVSERILSKAKTEPLTQEEVNLIEYYCVQLLAEIASRPPKDEEQRP